MGECVWRPVAHKITGCPSLLNIGAAIRAIEADDVIVGDVVRFGCEFAARTVESVIGLVLINPRIAIWANYDRWRPIMRAVRWNDCLSAKRVAFVDFVDEITYENERYNDKRKGTLRPLE
jgi:hypothetical protein